MFKWKDEFSVNIESIDKQHKELFKIGNMLYDILSLKDEIDRYDEIVTVLEKMKEYAVYHFSYEEKLMKENDYPEFEDHKKKHEEFMEMAASIDEEYIDQKQNEISMDLLMFVANWIEKHILNVDMKLKDYLNERGIY